MSTRKRRVARLLLLLTGLAVLGAAPDQTRAFCLGEGWYEDCTFCTGPSYEMLCYTRCFYCPDTGQTTCQYSGHYCNRCDEGATQGPCCPGYNPWPQCGW
jgi:hypothetical protein